MSYLLREVVAATLELNYSILHHCFLLLIIDGEYCIWNVAGDIERQLDTPIFNGM